MRLRLPPWVVLVLLAGLCAAIIAGVAFFRIQQRSSSSALLARLPSDRGAVILSIDFAALRRAGVLSIFAGSKMSQEPEYRSFVDMTGFDYLNDLDSALVSFHPSGTYLLLRGRFDWKNLKDYTTGHGGTCHNLLCRMDGSTPERRISYFPLEPNVMALAVSQDDSAVTRLQVVSAAWQNDTPNDPVWTLVPMAALRKADAAPAGTRAFIRALDGAEAVLFSAAPDGSRIELRLDATCKNDAAAASLVTHLRDITARLRDMIALEHQTPNPEDLSGVLAAGAFEQKGAHALGRWPVERSLLETLAGGRL